MRPSLYNIAGVALLALGSGETPAQPVGGIAAQSRADVRISVSVRPRLNLSAPESAAAATPGELGYTLIEVADAAPALDRDSGVSDRVPRASTARVLLIVPQ